MNQLFFHPPIFLIFNNKVDKETRYEQTRRIALKKRAANACHLSSPQSKEGLPTHW